jgi:glycosyltransferase A (GT-A) superfamily protein (DUF2064 family)
MTPKACALLVMAKAPVPGEAKTRLAPAFGVEGAAELAVAALLDTMEAVRSADVAIRIVALSGDMALARDADEIDRALADVTVISQDGATFADRLVRAHRDAALFGLPVLQIGMDTPQVTGGLLTMAADTLMAESTDAVLGMATDGGWWALGVTDAAAASVLGNIPMSRSDTGALTRAAIVARGCTVAELPVLTDVDTPEDARLVARRMIPLARFPRALGRLDRGPVGAP